MITWTELTLRAGHAWWSCLRRAKERQREERSERVVFVKAVTYMYICKMYPIYSSFFALGIHGITFIDGYNIVIQLQDQYYTLRVV